MNLVIESSRLEMCRHWLRRRTRENLPVGCEHGSVTEPVSPVPPHLRTITPRLVVRDGAAAIDFYALAFEAVEIGEQFTGPDGEVIHAEIRIGDSVVMITDVAVT